jgi:drug/metabolite transporter (DMT)-like permease
MGYLLLAILCSATIAITMRVSSGKLQGQYTMLAVNYLICGILGAVYSDFSLLTAQAEGLGITLALSVLNGGILLSGLLLLQISTRKNGIVLSSLFMKLGLLVPFVMSILFFQETPTVLQIAGFCVATGAIVLFNLHMDSGPSRFSPLLILLLLASGGCDAIVKVFEGLGPETLSNHFLCMSFSVAFLLCGGLVLRNRKRIDGKALLFGSLVGIANFFSAKFLLGALGQLPAVVVFPTYSVATMLLVTLTGILFFKERLDRRQWIAFATVIAALIMLNI